jgi:segregation and condensation protein A
VARFLAVLELFRSGLVAFDQLDPFADLVIAWIGADTGGFDIVDDYDAPQEEAP